MVIRKTMKKTTSATANPMYQSAKVWEPSRTVVSGEKIAVSSPPGKFAALLIRPKNRFGFDRKTK